MSSYHCTTLLGMVFFFHDLGLYKPILASSSNHTFFATLTSINLFHHHRRIIPPTETLYYFLKRTLFYLSVSAPIRIELQ